MSVGFRTSIENKIYQYNQNRPGKYFNETYENSIVVDSTMFNTLENSDEKSINEKILNNKDIFNRGFDFKKVEIDSNFPNFIVNNKEKLKKWIL